MQEFIESICKSPVCTEKTYFKARVDVVANNKLGYIVSEFNSL